MHRKISVVLQIGSCMQIYLPPTDKDQLLLELQKPARTAKALQALFDDRCLSYIKKEPMMEVLKDLVKTNKAITKAHNKSLQQDADGRPFNLLQMIIRYAVQPSGVIQHHHLCFVASYYVHPRVVPIASSCALGSELRPNNSSKQVTAAKSNKRVTSSVSFSKCGMASCFCNGVAGAAWLHAKMT